MFAWLKKLNKDEARMEATIIHDRKGGIRFKFHVGADTVAVSSIEDVYESESQAIIAIRAIGFTGQVGAQEHRK